ncbi:MAG: glycosyltransferase [Halobacteriota archaeon]|nr:glycosyltransferase [Halobacteriota archaeon]
MISIVVPTYNEEEHIKEMIEALLNLGEIEIIIAEDGSTDDTRKIIEEFLGRCDNVIISSEQNRRGKGAAIKRGLGVADCDIFGFIDADLATHPNELLKLKEEIDKGFDIAIGSRNLPDSKITKRQPFHRILLGNLYRNIVRSMLKVDVYDLQCGCKLFKREVWENVDVECDGFAFDTEFLAKANAKGYKISEVPIMWRNSEDSKVDPIKDTVHMFRTVLRVRSEIGAGEDFKR